MKAMVNVTLDGVNRDISICLDRHENPNKTIRQTVIDNGFDWVKSGVMVCNYPERGRALVKNAGYNDLSAVG